MKLIAADAERIRDIRRAGVGYREIGEYFDISKVMARNICIGRAWA